MTAYTASNSVPMSVLPTTNGVVQRFLVSTTNTGNPTYAPDGLGAAPIFGQGGQLLQGDEMVAGGIATLISHIGPSLNAGALCWVLVDCAGGARQVAPATQSQHAVQLGQIAALTGGGRLTRTTVYTLIDNVVNASVNGGPASPTPTFSTQPGTTMWEVEGVGSGGGGGGGDVGSDGNDGANSSSGGGAAGSYGWSIFTVAAVGAEVTIGAAGAGGNSSGANGGNGGAVSLGSLLTLPGGLGALDVTDFSNPAGGLPGAAPTGANVMGFPGEGGGAGALFNTDDSDGDPMLASGKGGSSKFGRGGQSVTAGSVEANVQGGAGSGFGAGGAGGGTLGGGGTSGVLVIREYS